MYRHMLCTATILLIIVPGLVCTKDSPLPKTLIDEDFADIEIGDVPAGWNGADAIAVNQNGGKFWMEAASKGFHRIRSPKMSIQGNFELELDVHLAYSSVYPSQVELTLQGTDGRDLAMEFVQVASSKNWDVKIGDSSKRVSVGMDRPNSVQLIRKGHVYRLSINGKDIIAQRMSVTD